MDEIELAVRRAQTQHPELGEALVAVADALWPGKDVDVAHQAAVQSFLWWDLPRRHDPREWDALAAAVAILLDAVGKGRLADIARSAQTTEVLEAWKVDEAAGVTAFRSARGHIGSRAARHRPLGLGFDPGP